MSFLNLKKNYIKLTIGENWEDGIGQFFRKDGIGGSGS